MKTTSIVLQQASFAENQVMALLKLLKAPGALEVPARELGPLRRLCVGMLGHLHDAEILMGPLKKEELGPPGMAALPGDAEAEAFGRLLGFLYGMGTAGRYRLTHLLQAARQLDLRGLPIELDSQVEFWEACGRFEGVVLAGGLVLHRHQLKDHAEFSVESTVVTEEASSTGSGSAMAARHGHGVAACASGVE